MNIEKSKILEVWNSNHNKVIKYKQVIKNNTLNEVTEIETENLNELISEVRKQLYEWNKII
jgi:TusA-related sulfurtransferase